MTDEHNQLNAKKLRARNVLKTDQCVVLYFDTHHDNLTWYWSVVLAGGVPALLPALSSNESTLVGELENVNKLLGGPTVLTSKRLAKPFRMIAAMTTVTVELVTATKEYRAAKLEPFTAAEVLADKLATVLFTSGSTGYAKGVEYTNGQLVMSSKLKCDFHNMDSSKTFLSWVSEYSRTS